MTPAIRRLAAILVADAAGYSRLMAANEEQTVKTVQRYEERLGATVRQHRGRIVDFTGDNFLAEFPSALDCVRGAVEIQRVLAEENDRFAADSRMEFRIGVHLGDVRVEGNRIYGDGVNIAARLEAMAAPGGICISGTVHEQVEHKLDLSYEDLGAQSVKNVNKPVHVYRVRVSPPSRVEIARPENPRKPSIAVLPFNNMSGHPEQDYFADGITEDLITGLSKISGLLVVARNTVFSYKGTETEEVVRDLGVGHLLEGSVRKAGDRVRITAKLIDASTGHHLWAERYDRHLRDIFAVQDDVTGKIIAALEVQVADTDRARFDRVPTHDLKAYDYFLRGESYLSKGGRQANTRARKMFERASELDPRFKAAREMLSWTDYSGPEGDGRGSE